jgi:hypothetical protein
MKTCNLLPWQRKEIWRLRYKGDEEKEQMMKLGMIFPVPVELQRVWY